MCSSFLFAETVQPNDVDKICVEIMDNIYNDLTKIKNTYKELKELRYENNVIGFSHGSRDFFNFPHFDKIDFSKYSSMSDNVAPLLEIYIEELNKYLCLKTDYDPSHEFQKRIIEILRNRTKDFTTKESSGYIKFQDELKKY